MTFNKPTMYRLAVADEPSQERAVVIAPGPLS